MDSLCLPPLIFLTHSSQVVPAVSISYVVYEHAKRRCVHNRLMSVSTLNKLSDSVFEKRLAYLVFLTCI